MNTDIAGNPASDEDSGLCSLCSCSKEQKKAGEDANRKLRYKLIKGLISELTLAAEEGCQNCSLVLDAIASWRNDQTVDPSCQITYIFYPEFLEIGFLGDVTVEVVFSPQYSATVDPIPVNNVWRLPDTRELSSSTSSDSTFLRLADLMVNCERYHKHCDRPFANPLPKRILEIATESVYLREAQNVSAKYACLSHCWGSSGPETILTKAGLRSLSREFPICELPKTFRDAVVVCQKLGISYIWIDALCIIQDSPEDWEEAANTMAGVYENACITIAAASAADSTYGLFSLDRISRRLSKHPQFYAKPQFPKLFREYGKPSSNKTLWPLFSRAWVYQERILSPRIVYFGSDEVYWECRNMFASEDDRVFKFREHDSLGERQNWTKDPAGSWRRMIEGYSGLQLTYEKDRLPAIAAIAYRISQLRESGDVYLAGMWKNSIISDLCWYCVFNPGPRPGRTVPSWSWASTQGSRIGFIKEWQECKVEVVSLTYNIVGGAYLGAVKNCKLVLRGYVLPLTEIRRLSHEEIKDIHPETPAESNFMLTAIRIFMRSHGLDLQYKRFYPDYDIKTATPSLEYEARLKLMLFTEGSYAFGGVVFRQLSKDSDEYERIGFINTIICNNGTKKIDMDHVLQSVPIEEILIV